VRNTFKKRLRGRSSADAGASRSHAPAWERRADAPRPVLPQDAERPHLLPRGSVGARKKLTLATYFYENNATLVPYFRPTSGTGVRGDGCSRDGAKAAREVASRLKPLPPSPALPFMAQP